jgi:hypothetical protein
MAFQISSATDVKCPLAGTLMVVPFGFTCNTVTASGAPALITQGIPYVSTIKQKNANVMTVTLLNSIVGLEGITAEINANTATGLGDYINPGNYTNINNGLAFSFDLNYISAGGTVGAWPNSATCVGTLFVQNVGGIRGGA